MEIKLKSTIFFSGRKLIMIIMRTFIFLCFTTVFGFSPNNMVSQNSKIKIEADKILTVDEVFDLIMQQTDYKFIYQEGIFKDFPKIEVKKGIIRTNKLLELSISGSGLNIEVVQNKTILIKRKQFTLSEAEEQQQQVSGTVSNQLGFPIPGVTVLIKSTNRGTTTDLDGNYTITVPNQESILVFSYLGFESKEVTVGNQTTINISLKEAVSELKEVTINAGYYKTTQRLATGSISKVTAKEIEKQPVTNPLMALQGRVTGLEITPSSGAPGIAPKIRIRGTNSLRQGSGVDPSNDGNYPLYVIDGVPINSVPMNSFTSSFTSGGYDPLSTINPANIESVEVLKDGDATAIFGSRGANGVILITTKRSSKSDERANIDVSAYTGVGQVSKQLDVLKLEEYLTMRREAISNSGSTPEMANAFDLIFWDANRSTDWQKVLLGGNSNITDIQTSISSGTKNTTFRFSGGYHKETLIFPGDFGYYRVSGQLSVNHISDNQKFKMSASSTYGLDNNHFFIGDLVSQALTLPPNAPEIYNEDGSLNWELHSFNGLEATSTWVNPLSYLKRTQNTNTQSNISNLNLGYELLPGLSLSANAGYTNVSNHEAVKTPQSSQSPSTDGGAVASATFVDNKRISWIIEPKIAYTKQIGEHQFNFVTGATWQKSKNTLYIASGSRYASDVLLESLKGAQEITIFYDDITEYKYNSFYARLGYNWSEKYLLNLTGRRDGSSRFGPGKRFGNFGAVGAAWIFSSEKFIQQAIPFMNLGKLRASYGITGSDNIGDYNYYNLYDISDSKYGGLTSIFPNSLYNPNYAWEVTKKLEAALELSFAQNRMGLEINWYRNQSSNQLVNYALSDVTGFPSVLSNFEATVQNTGWEAVLRGDVLKSDSWRWNASVNFSLPHNKLIKFDGIEDSPYANIYKVGEPLSVRWLYTWTGVNKETGLHDFTDQNNDGILNNLDRTVQNLTGTNYYGGINNTIQYKNLEMSLLFQFSHQQASRYLPGFPGGFAINQPVEVLNRWQQSGDETDVQSFNMVFVNGNLSDAYKRYNLLSLSNYNSTDASFIRLKTLSIGYRLPDKLLEKAHIQEGKIFLQGQNLLTLTKYEGLDPETGSGLPPLRMITLGLQLKL